MNESRIIMGEGDSQEKRMNLIYMIGAIVTLALFIYLVIALLKPEAFS